MEQVLLLPKALPHLSRVMLLHPTKALVPHLSKAIFLLHLSSQSLSPQLNSQ